MKFINKHCGRWFGFWMVLGAGACSSTPGELSVAPTPAAASSPSSSTLSESSESSESPPNASADPSETVGQAEEGLTVRGCGEWRTGTLTGYNNLSNDDNHTGSFNDYDHVTRDFLDHVNVVAIHEDDWGRGRYRNYELRVGSKTVRVQAWDLCSDRDDPACSRNKTKYAHPGYLFDMEARTARRLLGIGNAEDHLMQKVSFRVCDGFDPAPLARKYGLRRW